MYYDILGFRTPLQETMDSSYRVASLRRLRLGVGLQAKEMLSFEGNVSYS